MVERNEKCYLSPGSNFESMLSGNSVINHSIVAANTAAVSGSISEIFVIRFCAVSPRSPVNSPLGRAQVKANPNKENKESRSSCFVH